MSSWPLPCHINEYPKMLFELLHKVKSRPITLKQLTSQVAKERGLSEKWVINSLRPGLIYTGLAEIDKDGVLHLTELGEQVLRTRDYKLVIQSLIERIWGIREILLLLQNGSMTITDLYANFKKLGSTWEKPHQIEFRLRWLRGFGAVRRRERHYELTELGKQLADSLRSFRIEMEPLVREETREEPQEMQEEDSEPDHDLIKRGLLDIGRIEGYYVLEEYPMNRFRLDVVWKRVPTGNPVKVFEVQIKGNFYEALAKLKHAWDIWNSQIFLVTTEEFESQARWLVEGSFHEIKEIIKIINWRNIRRYGKLIKKLQRLRRELGF
ncbi:MAG: hypothetical protein DRJ47_10305 [Thermoprotei archaeon]|nr:MAG: hypothetical protein DRJ47_10305 [Thermoprotei archaeon]